MKMSTANLSISEVMKLDLNKAILRIIMEIDRNGNCLDGNVIVDEYVYSFDFKISKGSIKGLETIIKAIKMKVEEQEKQINPENVH